MLINNYKVIKYLYKDYVIIYYKDKKYIYLDYIFNDINLDTYNINYLIINNDIEIIKIKQFNNNKYTYYYKRLKLIKMIWRMYERLY